MFNRSPCTRVTGKWDFQAVNIACQEAPEENQGPEAKFFEWEKKDNLIG